MLYTHNGVTGLSYIGRLHWEFVDVNRANHGRWLHVVLLTLFFFFYGRTGTWHVLSRL